MAWMKSVRERFPNWFGARGRSVRSADQLGAFLSRHAAFIAQKCADDYCRNKVGLSHYALGEEQAYRDALAICRWEGYAAVLGGLLAVTQRQLIEAGFSADRIEAALVALYRRVLAGQRPPAHRPQGWEELVAALPGRLRAARADPPRSVLEIAAAAGQRLFEVLPIHASYRELDEPVVVGAVQFNFVGVSDRMRRELDAAALGRELGGTR
jgi:hypothetical protein